MIRRTSRRLRHKLPYASGPTRLLCAELTIAIEELEERVEIGDLVAIVRICQLILTFPAIRKVPFPQGGEREAKVAIGRILARVAEWLHLTNA